MEHSDEFHNELAQKTGTNSLKKGKKRLILKDKPCKFRIRFGFSKRDPPGS